MPYDESGHSVPVQKEKRADHEKRLRMLEARVATLEKEIKLLKQLLEISPRVSIPAS
jgi:cell division protein FtsB